MGILKKIGIGIAAFFVVMVILGVIIDIFTPTGMVTKNQPTGTTVVQQSTTTTQPKEEKYPTVGDTIKKGIFEITLNTFSQDYVDSKGNHYVYLKYRHKILNISAIPSEFLFLYDPWTKEAGPVYDGTFVYIYDPETGNIFVNDYHILDASGDTLFYQKDSPLPFTDKKEKVNIAELTHPIKIVITWDCDDMFFYAKATLQDIQEIENGEKCPSTYIFTVNLSQI